LAANAEGLEEAVACDGGDDGFVSMDDAEPEHGAIPRTAIAAIAQNTSALEVVDRPIETVPHPPVADVPHKQGQKHPV
jgi:hypothetical protein